MRGPYNADYPVGTLVRIADIATLEAFAGEWKHHNPLTAEQLAYAGVSGCVAEIGYYHGGDELYRLADIPGVWHEQNLVRIAEESGRGNGDCE